MQISAILISKKDTGFFSEKRPQNTALASYCRAVCRGGERACKVGDQTGYFAVLSHSKQQRCRAMLLEELLRAT